MALTDTAVVLPGTGHVLLGTTGATRPTLAQLEAFVASGTAITGFTDLGHTDLDDILTFGQDGGDSEVKGSWQNPQLREVVTEAAIDYLVIRALQLRDNTVLALYHGGGDVSVENEFAWPDVSTPQERAITIVMIDGDTPVALWAPKASIRREDSIEVSADEFAALPLRLTLLKQTGSPRAVWISDGLGTPA